jgi:hypothetical protein
VTTPGTRTFVEMLRQGDRPAIKQDEALDWIYIVNEVGDGPLSGDLVQMICSLSDPQTQDQALRQLVASLRDPGAAQETVAVVCGGLDASEPSRKALFDGFSAAAFSRETHYGVRAAALKGALYLGQTNSAWLYRLQADLLELTLSDDPLFLRHAAAVVGVVASHRPDPPFVDLLRSLLAITEASDEAAFGLGLVLLAKALGTSVRPEALALFDESLRCFATSTSGSEARADAGLFSEAVGILVDFGNGLAAIEIQRRLHVIQERLFDYLSLHVSADSRPPDQSWIGLRTTEAVHWAALSLKLSELADSLDRATWLDGVRVIEEQLFHILTASQTFFSRTFAGAIETVTGPRIETSFLKQKSHLAMLDEWLSTRGDSPWHEQARIFRGRVQAQLECAISRQSFDAASAASTLAAIERLGGPSSEKDRLQLAALLAGAEREFSLQRTDPVADEILQGMFKKLLQNDDFRNHQPASRFFIHVLLVTLKFVMNCDNAQDSPATAYMFTKPGDEPLEIAIQADYMNALRLSNLSRFCVPEPQGVGGGRADVHFSYCAYHLVTECKRNFENRTNKLALDAFGAQLVAYQVSSLTFSALLILDLYDRAGSVQNIRDRVSVETINPHGDRDYSFAVFRVQGHRKSPSAQKLKAIRRTNQPVG